LREDGSNLASVLYLLRERYKPFYDRIIETIRMVAPFFDDFVLQPIELNPNTILLEWREKGSDTYFNADMLSDGTLRFMCLATLLRQPNPPSLILIDEPELGLHPYGITLLAAMLKSAAVGTQVIVSTQSPTLINHFKPEDIIVVDREKQESTFRRLDSKELEVWLKEFNYTLSDLWEMNLVGGRP
jgi:predicted ATPase